MFKYYFNAMSCILITLVCLATMYGCQKKKENVEGHMKANSLNRLRTVCVLILISKADSQESPPATLKELIVWLEKHGFKEESDIDYSNKTIKDAWGHEIILIIKDGKLIGVGSPGSNGIWEKGTIDDLVVTLKEIQ